MGPAFKCKSNTVFNLQNKGVRYVETGVTQNCKLHGKYHRQSRCVWRKILIVIEKEMLVMRKILFTALASALLISSVTSAANLMIDEKSKTYDYDTAMDEINNSITAVGSTETETAKITIKPFFHSYIMSGDVFMNNGLPFQKPKSMLAKANGYVFTARGKSFATGAQTLAGVTLSVENKKDEPLVIDVNSSALQIADFYGQPFYTGQFAQQGNFTQPNLLIPPKQSKTVNFFRSDASFSSTRIMRGVWAAWQLPVRPVDFNKIHAELTLKVDDKYVSVAADGAIPEEIQKKYDQAAQMAAK